MCTTDTLERPVNDDNATFPANPEGVTFVTRPFPLEQAHEHFSRLRRWGFTFSAYSKSCVAMVRSIHLHCSSIPCNVGSNRARRPVSILPSSAVSHLTPRPFYRGQYDTEYLEYVHALLSLLPQYGMTAFVSMHQDVWSRYSGGSGAPAWTLTTVGFDLDALEETGAAFLKGVKGGGHTEDERGLWPCGYQKLAAATMA